MEIEEYDLFFFANSGFLTRRRILPTNISLQLIIPRSPGTHIVGSWAIACINSYKDPRTGTLYTGNWASRELLGSGTNEAEPLDTESMQNNPYKSAKWRIILHRRGLQARF